MAKRKTRREKEKTRSRQPGTGGFRVEFGPANGPKVPPVVGTKREVEAKYFQSDLTKVIVLTMLALASEVALWLILRR